jgi:hypothetical protein
MAVIKKLFAVLLISFLALNGSTLLGQVSLKFVPGLKDSVQINGTYWGILEIEKVDSTQRYSLNNDNSQARRYDTLNIIQFYSKVYLDRLASAEDKKRIIEHYTVNASTVPKIEFEYTVNISKSQQAGFLIMQASTLMNQRNNWRIFGGASAVIVGVIGAGSGIGLVVPVVIGTTTWIVSLSKDYKANNLLKSAGLLLQ